MSVSNPNFFNASQQALNATDAAQLGRAIAELAAGLDTMDKRLSDIARQIVLIQNQLQELLTHQG